MTVGYEALAERFHPIFERIGETALQRELDREHADEQIGWLIEAGLGGVRVPTKYGGLGASLSVFLRLVADLAEVDPNLAHIWRNHDSFVEDRLGALPDEHAERWLRRLSGGTIVGGGWSEAGPAANGVTDARIRPVSGGFAVTADKFYSTGSIYADAATVLGQLPDGTLAVALVAIDQPGVRVDDDWDGFGQQITGSGSVHYREAFVLAEDVFLDIGTADER